MIHRKFHIPGEDKKKEEMPVLFTLGFDSTNDVKYESMRNQMRHGRLYRRHRDLFKECEKQIRSYEKVRQMYSVEVDRCKQRMEDRLISMMNKTTDVNTNNLKYSYNEWANVRTSIKHSPRPKGVETAGSKGASSARKEVKGDNRTMLLFSVARRDGEDTYTKEFKTISTEDSGLHKPRYTRPVLLTEITM